MNKNNKLLIISLILLLSSIQTKTFGQIISDANQLNITGVKLNYIYFNFERSLKIAVTSQKDLAFIKEIQLPYNFDKSYQFHSSEIKKSGMYLSGLKMINFEANKLNKDVKTKLKFSKSEKRTKCVLLEEDKFGPFIDFIYSINDIVIGDTVLIDYSYSIPYAENIGTLTNYRCFFNDEINKKIFSFTLEYNKKLNVTIAVSNLQTPKKRGC